MSLQLTSPAFRDGHRIPGRYTAEGENLSPPLRWTGAPAETASFVLVVDDPDAPDGPFGHWAVFGIPADWRELPEGLMDSRKDSLRFGRNDMGQGRYSGPAPPRGHGTHHYPFRLAAIDRPTLELSTDATVEDVWREAQKHSIATAELIGLYERT